MVAGSVNEMSPPCPGTSVRCVRAENVLRRLLLNLCLKAIVRLADWSAMVEQMAAASSETTDTRSEPPRGWIEALLAGVTFSSALGMCGLFFIVWMVGDWIGDLHTSIRGLHAVGGIIAIGGCFLFLICSYVSVRAWQLRHPR
jgi:hypothetical protein